MVVVYERKNDEYINEIKTKEKYLNSLENSHEALEDEVEKLNEEIDELNRIKKENTLSDGNMATYYQNYDNIMKGYSHDTDKAGFRSQKQIYRN